MSPVSAPAISLAARTGDGYVNVTPEPGPVQKYRDEGGKGPAIAGMKVCWDGDERSARKLAFEAWKTERGSTESWTEELALRASSNRQPGW